MHWGIVAGAAGGAMDPVARRCMVIIENSREFMQSHPSRKSLVVWGNSLGSVCDTLGQPPVCETTAPMISDLRKLARMAFDLWLAKYNEGCS